MKFFMKLMIFMTFMAFAGPFFLKGPDGRPLMSLSSLGLGDIVAKFRSILNTVQQSNLTDATALTHDAPAEHPDGLVLVSGDQVFYRWQDENGIWQFTSEKPPATASNIEPVITNPNANVIQSLDQKKIDATLGISREPALKASRDFDDKQDKTAELSAELEDLGYTGAMNPVEAVPKLLEQTQQIKETMSSRSKVLDNL